MFWPRLQLTKKETERWTVYVEPGKAQRGVLYRCYNGEINLTSISKEDIENIQISRRARVFALTASGDVLNTEVQIYDSGGEQYTMGWIPLGNLLCGGAGDYRGMANFNSALNGLFSGRRFAYGNVYGAAYSVAPQIFDPNIVLEANQTLSIKGRNMKTLQAPEDSDGQAIDVTPTSHVSFCFHVWEFPIE